MQPHNATAAPVHTYAPAADVQQGIVYGFENDCVEKIRPEYLGRTEILELVERAASLCRIPIPKVIFGGDRTWPCLAHIREWALTINDWGRSPTTVLHEIAHLVTFAEPRGRMEMMRGQAHGPVFVRNAITLYADFLGVSRARLERRAMEFGLEIAPAIVDDAPPTGNFFDEEF